MQTIPCPGCRTDLDPSATVCHICTRPRGKLEITRGFATLREMEKQRKKRPFIIAGRVLTAAVVGGLLYRFHEPILSAASAVQASGSKLANDLLYPAVPASAPAPAAPPAAPNPPVPAQSGAVRAPSAPAPSAFPPTAPAAPADATAAKTPKKPAHVDDLPFPPINASTHWIFYGRVFDLVTLQPVANAQLNFSITGQNQRADNMGGGDHTDELGRFAATMRRLPDGASYEIRASRAGYTSIVFYESDIPYATLPLAERREMARQAQDGDMTLPPLNDVAGELALRRDIYLAPSR